MRDLAREVFRRALNAIGVYVPRSEVVFWSLSALGKVVLLVEEWLVCE